MLFTFRPIERWPQEPTPSHLQRSSTFRVTYEATLKLLSYELERLGAKRAFIQADVSENDIRISDGALRSASKPRSSRIIVSAETKHGSISLPCDTYRSWKDNVRAIALSLEALRAVDRHGVTKRGEQYRGLKQLTSGSGPINSSEAAAFLVTYGGGDSQQILGSIFAFYASYRAAARVLHSDTGGDVEKWHSLQKARVILEAHHEART